MVTTNALPWSLQNAQFPLPNDERLPLPCTFIIPLRHIIAPSTIPLLRQVTSYNISPTRHVISVRGSQPYLDRGAVRCWACWSPAARDVPGRWPGQPFPPPSRCSGGRTSCVSSGRSAEGWMWALGRKEKKYTVSIKQMSTWKSGDGI